MRWSPLVQIESNPAASACCASSLITDHGRTGSTPPPHHSSIGMIIPTFTLPILSRLVLESRRPLRQLHDSRPRCSCDLPTYRCASPEQNGYWFIDINGAYQTFPSSPA